MLLPALQKAREKARQASCTGNVKQLALAAIMYADENDEITINYSVLGLNNGSTYYRWEPHLWPYLGEMKVTTCPSVKLSQAGSQPMTYIGGYGYNYFYLGHQPLGSVKTPEDTVMFTDVGRTDSSTSGIYRASHVNPPHQSTYTYICRPDFRHSRFSTVSFQDGHVEPQTYGRFYPRTVYEGGTWTGGSVSANVMWDRN